LRSATRLLVPHPRAAGRGTRAAYASAGAATVSGEPHRSSMETASGAAGEQRPGVCRQRGAEEEALARAGTAVGAARAADGGLDTLLRRPQSAAACASATTARRRGRAVLREVAQQRAVDLELVDRSQRSRASEE
jgi:hypothetical protein